MTRVARTIVGLYPLAWRRRYAEEMLALLQERPPGVRDVADLLVGAARAHLRPSAGLSERVAPGERMRDTVTAVALCWGVVVLAGAGFAKETEDPVFQMAANAHRELAVLRDSIMVVAAVGALIVLLAGAPLLWWVVHRAWCERRRDLLWRLAVAPASLLAFAAVTGGLLWWFNGRQGTAAPHTGVRLLSVVWLALGIATGLACAHAPRLVLLRVDAPEALLRRAVVASGALTACMAVLALATAAYGLALAAQSPGAASQSGGPLWPTTLAAIAASALGMAVAVALAALSCRRGRRVLARR